MVCIFFAKVHFLRKRGKVSILKITAPHIFFTLARKKQNRGVHLPSLSSFVFEISATLYVISRKGVKVKYHYYKNRQTKL